MRCTFTDRRDYWDDSGLADFRLEYGFPNQNPVAVSQLSFLEEIGHDPAMRSDRNSIT